MKTTEIMSKASDAIDKAGFQLKKHSPEILVVAGVIGAVASAVMACKATLKAEKVLDETKEKMNKVHESTEKGRTEAGEEYSAEDAKKDTTLVYIQAGAKLAKLYAPAVALGAMSITGILTANNILRKRNVALAAAYTAVDKSFKEYRNRVIERFGQEIDRELKYNIKAEKVKKTVVDEETGKEKKVKETTFLANPSGVSGYAKFYEKYTLDEEGNSVLNPNWENNNDYNFMFLKAQQRLANDVLRSRKRLFLNEVYHMLGLPATKAGQIVGWIYDPENPVGDNYVDFNLCEGSLIYSDCADETAPGILLDFNVDGNIWELM